LFLKIPTAAADPELRILPLLSLESTTLLRVVEKIEYLLENTQDFPEDGGSLLWGDTLLLSRSFCDKAGFTRGRRYPGAVPGIDPSREVPLGTGALLCMVGLLTPMLAFPLYLNLTPAARKQVDPVTDKVDHESN
jgi:hypothetical protein